MNCVKVQISRQPRAPVCVLVDCRYRLLCCPQGVWQHSGLLVTFKQGQIGHFNGNEWLCICTYRAVDQSLLTDMSQLRLTIQISKSLTCWHYPAAAPVTQSGPPDSHRHPCSHADGLTEKRKITVSMVLWAMYVGETVTLCNHHIDHSHPSWL